MDGTRSGGKPKRQKAFTLSFFWACFAIPVNVCSVGYTVFMSSSSAGLLKTFRNAIYPYFIGISCISRLFDPAYKYLSHGGYMGVNKNRIDFRQNRTRPELMFFSSGIPCVFCNTLRQYGVDICNDRRPILRFFLPE